MVCPLVQLMCHSHLWSHLVSGAEPQPWINSCVAIETKRMVPSTKINEVTLTIDESPGVVFTLLEKLVMITVKELCDLVR
jgi:hypothetical protein